jgi:hypothetical protein
LALFLSVYWHALINSNQDLEILEIKTPRIHMKACYYSSDRELHPKATILIPAKKYNSAHKNKYYKISSLE